MRKAGFLNQRFPGEKHIPLRTGPLKFEMAEYAGPGTNLQKRLEKGIKPKTQADKSALAHDIRYELAKTPDDVRKADDLLINATQKIDNNQIDDPETPYHSSLNTFAVRNAIRAKTLGEDVKLFDQNTFTKPGSKKLTPEKEKILRDKLDELQKLGYGVFPNRNKNSIRKNKFYSHDYMAEEQVAQLNHMAESFKKFLDDLASKGMVIPQFGGYCDRCCQQITVEEMAGDLIGGMVELINLLVQKGDLKPMNPNDMGPKEKIDIITPPKKIKPKKTVEAEIQVKQEPKDEFVKEILKRSGMEMKRRRKTEKKAGKTPSRYVNLVRELRKDNPELTYNEARKDASRILKTV